ncbi:hypothetical protein QEZ47_13045 [Aminobacter anthyllidis]|uniref:hypothetical protein n=1 Tax=Aminobacter anthyllidis TaxID=1035067 RepID=UPI002456E2BF|nr:hypothetical protein [Aminobacter anthyllidis]MDH4986438.1 hypothetical protein [Aminobacter anthyllidis]
MSKPEQANAHREQKEQVAHRAVEADMLTSDEIEALRRDKIESGDFYRKAFEHLRPRKK